VHDREGLTPLLRVAKLGNLCEASKMLKHFPDLIQVRDYKGRSFLHLLVVDDDEWSPRVAKKLYEQVPTMDAIRKTKDFDGNTPLYSTIQDGNSVGAKLIAERCVETDDFDLVFQQLATFNDQGQDIAHLVAADEDAPIEVQT